jgi:tartrate dehydratase beta subunit/fumarate hydratase class I family protein
MQTLEVAPVRDLDEEVGQVVELPGKLLVERDQATLAAANEVHGAADF